MRQYHCLLCNTLVGFDEMSEHKQLHHSEYPGYGMMWPLFKDRSQPKHLAEIPIHESSVLAEALGVEKVWIRDEGQNLSGSMKDYSTRRAVKLAKKAGYEQVTVVSCGNHAFSLAKQAELEGLSAICFTPASSSKIPLLAAMKNVTVVAVRDAIFEDVYRLAADLDLPGVYNANVSNEDLIFGFMPVAREAVFSFIQPDFILAGAGNGSYLAGIALAYQRLGIDLPKIMPVGMKGAFPVSRAFELGQMIYEHSEFMEEETLIDAAEGSIAIASYSMPQLMRAMRLSGGRPLGGLLNRDLAKAYRCLNNDSNLVDHGAIPEPTGIMGLASAMKHDHYFGSNDRLMISFTGNGMKDLEGIRRLVPDLADGFEDKLRQSRPDLAAQDSDSEAQVIYITKETTKEELRKILERGT